MITKPHSVSLVYAERQMGRDDKNRSYIPIDIMYMWYLLYDIYFSEYPVPVLSVIDHISLF